MCLPGLLGMLKCEARISESANRNKCKLSLSAANFLLKHRAKLCRLLYYSLYQVLIVFTKFRKLTRAYVDTVTVNCPHVFFCLQRKGQLQIREPEFKKYSVINRKKEGVGNHSFAEVDLINSRSANWVGRNWDKSLTSFHPCYLQSPLVTDSPPPLAKMNWTGL
jgi:hypothetical protein